MRMSKLARSFLMTSAVVAAGSAFPAAAQNAFTTEEVVVTGYRAANLAAVKAKQSSEVVLDAISQDDIGSLPDVNIVEAARRITGLSTVGGLDPNRNRDIYERVTIRGLDPKYNLITVDGAPLASSEYTVRGARLDQFPNSLVARIEAIKTLTAEYDPHGLGGQINIVSRSAFDNPGGRFLAVNASVGHNTTSGNFLNSSQPNVRADATGSTLFGSRDQFGVSLTAEYQKLWSSVRSELPGDTDGSGWTYYTASGAKTPFASLSRDGNLVVVRPQDYRFDDERTRIGANAKLEYRLPGGDTISLFSGYYFDQDKEFRAELLTTPGGTPSAVTQNSGTQPLGNLQQGIVLQPMDRNTLLLTGKGDFTLADKLTFKVTASYSNATSYNHRTFQKWANSVKVGSSSGINTADAGYSYVINGDGAPVITHLGPKLGSDPNNYVLLYVRDVGQASGSNLAFAKAELAYNAEQDARGFGVKLGGAFTSTLQKFDQTYQELVAANTAAQQQIGGLTNFIYSQTFSALAHSDVPFLVVNPDKVTAFVKANPSLFSATDQRANNYASDFNDTENVGGVYAEATYHTDKLSIVAGLRFDQTDVTTQTYQVPTVASSTAYEQLKRNSTYSFLLPSALVTYRIADDMRLIAGVSKTIGRPDYSQYAAQTTYSIGTSPGYLTINTGNPALKPREAMNYDLSYEWYLPGGGLVSAAGFLKDISNEIFTGTQQGSATTYLGVTYPNVTISEPLNAAHARIKGLELAYTQNSFGFLTPALDGLGMNTNFTLLRGSFDLPASSAALAVGAAATRKTSGLIQQPGYIFNTTVFYEWEGFEARLSYNRLGRALQSANQDTPERDLYQEPRQQIDAQLRYSITPDIDVSLKGQNLTQEAFVVRQGPGRRYLNNLFPVGATYWLSFSWKPNL